MAVFPRRDRDRLPDAVRSALDLSRSERVLAWAKDDLSDSTVVATTHALYAVDPAGTRALARPWHVVDAGSWSADLFQLTVTWVDGARPVQWVCREPTMLPETLRERVQASVVLMQRVDLGGRRSARAVIRQDLATGELVQQVVLGRGVRSGDPDLEEATASALAYLREQVGLD
jgi:hypothetical protein